MVFSWKGGERGGTEREKTEADSSKGAGRESGEAEPEHGGAETGEESAALPFLAGR